MKSVNWGPSVLTMESAASAEAYITNNYTVRVQTYSRAYVHQQWEYEIRADTGLG